MDPVKAAIHVLLVLAALAVLAYPAGVAVDAAYGHDVYLLSALNADDTVEINRAVYAPEGLDAAERIEAVVAIYGSNAKLELERVLLFDDTHVIRPAEMPELWLLPAGSAGGKYPAQSQSLLYVTRSVTLAGLAAAVVLLALRFAVLRRSAPTGTA